MRTEKPLATRSESFVGSDHCCPVEEVARSGNTRFGRGLRAKMGGVDLNFVGR